MTVDPRHLGRGGGQAPEREVLTRAGAWRSVDGGIPGGSKPSHHASTHLATGDDPVDVAQLENIVTSVGTPGTDGHVPTEKAVRDAITAAAFNLGKRSRVRAATTANITISTALNNGDTIDGVTLATDDLVLVKNQSSAAENGVYVVGVTPARSPEFDSYDEYPGSLIVVEEGTVNADGLWLCTSNGGGTLGVTAIVFAAFSAGISQLTGDVTAGPGVGSQVATLNVTALQAKGYWSPLTNGDGSSPALIFDSFGDTISIWTGA